MHGHRSVRPRLVRQLHRNDLLRPRGHNRLRSRLHRYLQWRSALRLVGWKSKRVLRRYDLSHQYRGINCGHRMTTATASCEAPDQRLTNHRPQESDRGVCRAANMLDSGTSPSRLYMTQKGTEMDGDKFDRITRSLAQNVSRRSVLRGLPPPGRRRSRLGHWRERRQEGAPNPCNVYCAGESGSRGAQCRQTCKAWVVPTPAGFCYDELGARYTVVLAGSRVSMPGDIRAGKHRLFAGAEQVCSQTGGSFCCEPGTYCVSEGTCCPIGVESCYDTELERYVCGSSCRNYCSGRVRGLRGAERGWQLPRDTCYNPCSQQFDCGEPDELGNCSVETCKDLCSGETVCSTPNAGGNCIYSSCYDTCAHEDRCGDRDDFGNCVATACFDPASETTTCGSSCYDICTNRNRCGSVEGNPWGYCNDTFCFASNGGFACGTPDDDGACIE